MLEKGNLVHMQSKTNNTLEPLMMLSWMTKHGQRKSSNYLLVIWLPNGKRSYRKSDSLTNFKISFSGQNVTHNFTLIPSSWGEYDPERATVQYRQTAKSEPLVILRISSFLNYDRNHFPLTSDQFSSFTAILIDKVLSTLYVISIWCDINFN